MQFSEFRSGMELWTDSALIVEEEVLAFSQRSSLMPLPSHADIAQLLECIGQGVVV